MQQQNRKPPVIFYVGLVLLCAVLFTTHLTGGLYARYLTTSSGGDAAVVAKFEVGETLSSLPKTFDVAFDAAGDEKQSIQITNTGEVAVSYQIAIEKLTDNLPIAIVGADGQEIAGTLSQNGSETVSFLIQWEGEKDPAYAGMVDLVRITVTIEQVD